MFPISTKNGIATIHTTNKSKVMRMLAWTNGKHTIAAIAQSVIEKNKVILAREVYFK